MARSARRALRSLERAELASRGEPPINLVPMIDILTVLVLYLLVGSIFRQFTVLPINLPGPATPAEKPPPGLELKVVLRDTGLEVRDRNGTVRLLPKGAQGYDLAALGATLADVKRKVPSEDSVEVDVEPDIAYEALIQVMDTARVFPAGSAERTAGQAMFPNVGLGDARKGPP
ncbi:MAG TPA: biopolymer transporter ExbD [Candidatus Binatia bacterium]|nr:biopolymer transporter ExbD [Candidatus Binatia bacterium]